MIGDFHKTAARLAAGVIVAMGMGGLPVLAAESSAPAAATHPAVDGLVVTLTPETATWRVGAPMAFEATLRNVGPRAFLVDLFGDLQELYEGKHRGSFVSSCWALTWDPHAVVPGPRRGRYPLTADQFRRLSPGESYRRSLSLVLSAVAPGTYRVRLAYVPRAATSAFSFPDHWQRQQHLEEPMWLGMALSNPVTIEVVDDPPTEVPMAFEVTSAAFRAGEPIPSRYTCEGEDVSPPLGWTEPPAGTRSLALIADDPDAPRGTWVHWVLYNLSPSMRRLPEAVPTEAELPDGARHGTTDFGRTGYGGPCPPSGTHRYFFKLYALDALLSLRPGSTARQLEQAMAGHILAQAQVMGTYRRAERRP